MDALHKLQQEFLGYLLDNSEAGVVSRIESTSQCSAENRMRFYGNAYVLRLKEALATDFERLHAYMGDQLFDDLMEQYIEDYPSHQTSLRYFGQYMAELIEKLDIVEQAPELVEIAKIELAFGNSFDATDAAAVELEALTQLVPDLWAMMSLRFHNSVQLLPQRYNSFQIWRALSNEQDPPPRIMDNSTWLIWRQNLVSRYRSLDNGEQAALRVALSGGSFSDMCEKLLDYFTEDETPQRAVAYLQQWINDQLVVEVSIPE